MRDAKNGGTAGFSLVEVLTAITVLGLMLAPIGASLVMSHRLNARSQQLMEDQLAVSNAVETLMAEGIDERLTDEELANQLGVKKVEIARTAEKGRQGAAYPVKVTSGDVEVETYIRPADKESETEDQEVETPNEA